ncbi:mannosyltransferase [Multifurca ochricompacta]|uniref:GDP-Man:Man(3)GlcNAc(2)-PP-Dol alpha-1,2-mannosyltransferase n=1 Tax=Multifurca ochricompacta TaxID=376703 RepID=A0AAD4QK63_9AGAM|nr:mannosyltransferase [Multifurca ochricompacta]
MFAAFLILILPFLILLLFISHVRQLRRAITSQRAAALSSSRLENHDHAHTRKKFIGFFHPYCNAGGGGERVLWTAVAFMQRTQPNVINVVYSGDVEATKEQIIEKVKSRFDIALAPDSLHFVFLESRRLVEDRAWPRFTLLGQSLGSMYLAWEAMSKFVPDLYIDTMGYAFTFHVVAWLAGIPIGAYVHYPTISTDMLARVEARRATYANSNVISSSTILSRGKLLYYRLFMYHYALALRRSSFLMVNSSWTKNHIDAILAHSDPFLDFVHLPLTVIGTLALSLIRALTFSFPVHTQAPPKRAAIVYPPCDTHALSRLSLDRAPSLLLSLAQFRPEKDHGAQIRMMAALLKQHPEHRQAVRLLLGDYARVSELKALAVTLQVSDHVEFVVNAPYPRILELLGQASVGLNTMVDEHFGINVVEFMVAGVIPVVHASGGPLHDIVVPVDGQRTGFHAKDPESFAQSVHEVMAMSEEERRVIRARARQWAMTTFSEEAFQEGWTESGWARWL